MENSVGMYLRAENTNSYANLILKDYDIRLGNKARESVLFFNEGTNSYNRVSGTYNYKGESTLDNSMVQSINVDAGEDNMVIYNSGSIINSEYSSVPIINIKPDIKIGTESKPVDGTIAIYNTGGIAHLTGDIETYGESSHAVYNDSVSKVVGTVTNTKGSTFDNIIGGNAKALSIITHGDNSAVFYNKESVINIQEGGTFKDL